MRIIYSATLLLAIKHVSNETSEFWVEVETIMKIVGHSSVEMFLRYRKIKAEKLDAAMHRLNTLITRRQRQSAKPA